MKYRYKTRPYHHQVAALKKMRELDFKGALLMEPRTGKTKVAIDSACILHQAGKVNRVMVVVPNSVIGVWEDELKAHCSFPYRVVVWDKEGRKSTSLPPWTSRLTFVIINYEAFQVPGRKLASGKRSRSRGGKWEVRKALRKWQPQLMILDESHRIKSPSAAKTRMLHSVSSVADYRLLLTGTVLTKKHRAYDIWSQWKFMNPRSPLVAGHTAGSFKAEYSVFTNRSGYPRWLRNRNPNRLKRLIHEEAFAVRRDECFDLPLRRNQIIPVELSGHTAEVYDEMAAEMVAKIKTGEITEASIKLVQSLRLAQITSGLVKTTPSEDYPDARLLRIGRDKLNVIQDLLTDYKEAEEKVVIGARFIADIRGIMTVCEKLKIPCYPLYGAVPRRERDENIRAFREKDGPAVFVMQPQAGSLGIDLSTASIFIWMSLPGGNWVDFTQSEDRVALSKRPTVFMYLIAKGTIDQVQYDALMEDGDVAKEITTSPDILLRDFKREWVPKERKNKKVAARTEK